MEFKGEVIVKHLFNLEDEALGLWQCKLCPSEAKRKKQGKNGGYTNLISHLNSSHPDWKKELAHAMRYENEMSKNPLSSYFPKKVSPKSANLYGWLEWGIMGGQPFNFVEDIYVRRNVKREHISRNTLVKYMEKLGTIVEQKLAQILPDQFGLIIDGWTCNGEHYIAIFATWTDDNGYVKTYLLCCGVQDELPEDEENTDFTAESIGDYISDELNLVGKGFQNLQFISGDNCSVNKKLCALISSLIRRPCPLLGCASHRLNLAVKLYLVPHADLIAKGQNVMTQLRTLKNRSMLRRVSRYAPKLAQDTRWGSTFTMLQRYMVLEPNFRECAFDDELKQSFLKRNEKNITNDILEDLEKFESVSMQLQSESNGLNLAGVRVLFDGKKL